MGSGLSLRFVANAIGTTHGRVARFERGEIRSTDTDFLGAYCSVVGLDLALRGYPGGDALRDQGHADLLERLRRLLHHTLRWRLEVPLPIERDRRAWDAVIGGPAWDVPVEGETRLDDGQALERKLTLKLRDGRRSKLIVLVADTAMNRAALAVMRPALRELLPLDARPILAALREGREAPGSGIVLL